MDTVDAQKLPVGNEPRDGERDAGDGEPPATERHSSCARRRLVDRCVRGSLTASRRQSRQPPATCTRGRDGRGHSCILVGGCLAAGRARGPGRTSSQRLSQGRAWIRGPVAPCKEMRLEWSKKTATIAAARARPLLVARTRRRTDGSVDWRTDCRIGGVGLWRSPTAVRRFRSASVSQASVSMRIRGSTSSTGRQAT